MTIEAFRTIYQSRNGVGFPSCNRALARLPRNHADPGGYYRELGIDPAATQHEIKLAFRTMYKKYHPDGWAPDAEKFARIVKIGYTLLDPDRRDTYNKTPEGYRMMDLVHAEELMDQGLDREEVEALLKTQLKKPEPRNVSRLFDYMADSFHPEDLYRANAWYTLLVDLTPAFRYTRTIKVHLSETCSTPEFYERVLVIPRHWTPSFSLAFTLFARCVAPIGLPHTAG